MEFDVAISSPQAREKKKEKENRGKRKEIRERQKDLRKMWNRKAREKEKEVRQGILGNEQKLSPLLLSASFASSFT